MRGPRRPSPRSRRRRPSPAVPTAAGPSFESVGEATEDDDSVLGDGAPKAAQLSRARSRVEGREGAHQSSVAAVKGFENQASQIAEAIKKQERGDDAVDPMVMHPSAEWRRYWDDWGSCWCSSYAFRRWEAFPMQALLNSHQQPANGFTDAYLFLNT